METTTFSNWTESRLQSECFKFHYATYPNERGLLFTVDNNANDRVKGSIRLAMGRVAGVSDMIYFFQGRAYCFEMKLPGAKQSQVQRDWEDAVTGAGAEYILIRTLDQFKEVLSTIHIWDSAYPI